MRHWTSKRASTRAEPSQDSFDAQPPSTTSEIDNSKKAKRRSLLPQFNRKVSGEEKIELGIQEEDEDTISKPGSDGTRASEESVSRRGLDEDRKAMPPPPSRLSRPASFIPPRGASQGARTSVKPVAQQYDLTEEGAELGDEATDARAQSLAALTGTAPATPSKPTMPVSGLQRAGSTRLPQSPRVGGPAIPSRTTSNKNHNRMTSMNPGSATTSSIAEKRSSVARPRPPSQTESSVEGTGRRSPPSTSMMSRGRPASQLTAPPTSPSKPPAGPRARPTSVMLPPSKPAFNTYQQHYSPAKTALPKPPLPSSKTSRGTAALPEDPSDVTFDIAQQQIELLQLSLLHQASSKCMHEYSTSARRKLNKKHTRLRKDYESIRATELVQQRIANLSALEAWCRDPSMLVENLQILSLVYSDLTALIEEGSRHGDVVSTFELWMNEAEFPEAGSFIKPLPDEWKTAHASLALKLRSIQRNLGVLPQPKGPGNDESGLAVVLRGCKTLVDGMMKELEVMVKLEKEVMGRERTRLEDDIKALVLDDVGMQPAWRPAWNVS
jgi:hypothetical protein